MRKANAEGSAARARAPTSVFTIFVDGERVDGVGRDVKLKRGDDACPRN